MLIVFSDLLINLTKLINNTALLDGGAIYFEGSQILTYKLELGKSLTFENNTANAGGCVLY